MANETDTGTLLGSFFAIYADTNLIPELRPHNVSRPFFRYAANEPTLVHQWAVQDDEGAATAAGSVTTLDEGGSGFSNTAVSSTTVAATAAVAGFMTTISDELVAVAPQSFQHTSAVLGRSVAERQETDMSALYGAFSNTTGTTTVNATLADFLNASIALKNRDVTGSIVSVLHPQQVGDLQQDLAQSGAAYWGNSQAMINGLDAASFAGYVGAPHGIPLYQTSTVATANAGEDRGGAMFEAGVALGLYEVWGPRVRTERDESGPGEEIVCTACYGVIEIHDSRGQSIITDA